MALIGGNTPLLEVPTTKIDDIEDSIEDEAQTKKFGKKYTQILKLQMYLTRLKEL